jgi:CRP/FNR family transcriptional regulator
MDQSVRARIPLSACQVACSDCSVHRICLPGGLKAQDLGDLDHRLVAQRRKVARGESLFHAGDRFDSIYAVWTGFFKTSVASRDGRDQVSGFQMCGDLVGLDGIGTRRHEIDAVALEDSQVCVIHFDELEALLQDVPPLRQQFHRILSREIVRHQVQMLLLGSMYAEERLAAFLIDLMRRLQDRGYSPSAILLRMSREEIGSLLGLTIETVSRIFTKFQSEGLLSVRNRHLGICNPAGLHRIAEGRPN